MGSIANWFGSRTVAAFVERARAKLAAGKLEDAAKIVKRGLEQFPGSNSLLDLRLTLRRADAHKTMRALEARIESSNDPVAFEDIIKLYQDLELPEEARRKADRYVRLHASRDKPHHLLGEMDLAAFLEDFVARRGHAAYESLAQAASLNALALEPRLLLAELYFCIGADRSMATLLESLRQLAPDTPVMNAALEIMESAADADADERIDAIFARIELEGRLMRDPDDWPLSHRNACRAYVNEENAETAVRALVTSGALDEVVLLRRDGSVIAHAEPGTPKETEEDQRTNESAQAGGLVGVVRTISRRVFPQSGEFDMGRFKHCAVRSGTGNVVVGRVGNLMVGVRGARSDEPIRMWERLSVELESVCGSKA